MSNTIKSEQLGMSFGKAGSILRKSILFSLVQQLSLDTCYRCKQKIENIKEFTIDHKKDWLYSANPSDLFFDINNIVFSHANCNRNSARKTKNVMKNKHGYKGIKDTKNGKYQVGVSFNNQRIYVGIFTTAKEAAIAYDEKIIELFGKDAATNKSLGLLG